ncbi:MAG: phenylacetate-CoA oxygenase subunit PaaI [Gemmatimonadota bacterium]|nr:phenylacetate-CoA oxygenase subunit PaaI [Gemmatimonadota bacterium]
MSDTKTAYKSASELSEETRNALGALLLALADNKRLLGIRYSDWILGAPSVEAGIACSAMAQDEWGHGRIVYSMLKDFGFDPHHLEHEREAEEYHSAGVLDSDGTSWPELIALNFLLDTALTVQFETLHESRFEPIHYKVRKLLDEERFHFEHGRGWTARLAETEAGREALAEAFGNAWTSCLAWFGPDDDAIATVLATEGIVSGDAAATRGRWLARVGPVLSAAGMDLAREDADGWVSDAEPNWSAWSTERRRVSTGGPDEDTLARVRGDRNRSLLID